MKDKRARKQEALTTLLQKENWELEAIKGDAARAQRLLNRENQALQKVNQTIEDTFLELRKLMESDSALEIDVVQKIKRYLAQVSVEQLECKTRQAHVLSEAEKISQQLKRKLLYTRGLETIETTTSNAIQSEQEKKEQQNNEELWLQRHGRRK